MPMGCATRPVSRSHPVNKRVFAPVAACQLQLVSPAISSHGIVCCLPAYTPFSVRAPLPANPPCVSMAPMSCPIALSVASSWLILRYFALQQAAATGFRGQWWPSGSAIVDGDADVRQGDAMYVDVEDGRRCGRGKSSPDEGRMSSILGAVQCTPMQTGRSERGEQRG
ncbi:hypothetical protein BDP81DRAFT_66382 [Colletotrichum phormii]|uniref:Uncharacterized protein n=1 Tax=Colletotrichum phormii TaxID=359342 RepID=A0AAJ0EBZ6_9PEZI|nr:uncharacterized protein BDP81DRAFT_66382 [Colletotrichum phormii]KAK1634162.1 hypothetical protein BDP81DRAFT_66382 [Colletotrichum phormii]